ncbi:MFS transporter [Streptomyces sp. PB17]|uniref:MFS transporter n=1 Tax=Streptomyces sp. PB17 TaxID=3384158 RepID=UPI0038B448EA
MSPTHATPGRPSPSPLLLPVVLLGIFVMPISITGAAIALPDISRDLGSDPTLLQGVVNGFNIALTISTLLWGQIGNRIGLRRTFVIGLATVLLGAVGSALAGSLILLDLARIITGVGAAAIATGGTSIISHAYDGKRRAHVFALLGTIVGIGLAAGPTLSGLLVTALGWRGVFGVVAGVAALVLAAAAFGVLPAPSATSTGAAPHRGFLDLSPLRSPRFLAVALVPVAASFAYVSALTYAPIALSAVHGQDAATAGLFMLPLTLPVLVGPLLTGALITRTRVSPHTVINTAIILLITGDVLFLLFDPSLSPVLLMIPMILLGFGWGLPLGLVDGEALASVPAHSSAAAAGVLNFLRLGSEALAVAVFGAALAAIIGAQLGNPALGAEVAAGATGHAAVYASGFRMMMIACAVVTTVIGAAVILLRRAGGTPAPHSAEDELPTAAKSPTDSVPVL